MVRLETSQIFSASALNPNDIGKNWQDLGVISASGVGDIVYLGGGVVLFGSNTHVFRSADYGFTWSDLGVISADPIQAFAYFGNGIVCFCTTSNNHIFRSTDYGQTWTDLGSFSAFGLGTSIAYFGNGIGFFGRGTGAGATFKTTDFGATWSNIGAISIDTCRIFYYLDNSIALLGNSDGSTHLQRSINFGTTWTDLGQIGTLVGLFSIAYLGNGVVLLGDNKGKLARSTDFGATWTSLGQIGSTTNSGGTNNLAYLGGGINGIGTGVVVYGDGSGQIFRSTDFGLTWTLIFTGPAGIGKMIYLDNGVVLAASGTHVLRSEIVFKKSEASIMYQRNPVDQTAARSLNTTFTNTDKTRSLLIVVGARCVTPVVADVAFIQAVADSATPPVTAASPIVGIQSAAAPEDSNFELTAIIKPGLNYRVNSTTAATGTATLDKWFETLI